MSNISKKDTIVEKLQKFNSLNHLKNLKNYANEFNVFNALKLENLEIRHSNFLAWLFNPLETHNIGDYFLKEFLLKAINNYGADSCIKVTPDDISEKDFNKCEIFRENNNIDILIKNSDNNFLCIVENKIRAKEGDNQLKRYADLINKIYDNSYKKLYIYLTPNSNFSSPLLQRGNVFYIQMSYDQVIEAIEKTLKEKADKISIEVKFFIEHYKKMLERDIMEKTDDDIETLCREIYREHKDAIDLINRCTAKTDRIISICEEIVSENHLLELKMSKPWGVQFFIKGIDLSPIEHNCEQNIYLQLSIGDGEINLHLFLDGKNTGNDISMFLEEKINHIKTFNDKELRGFLIKTLVSKNIYWDLICLPKEEIKAKLKKEFDITNIVNNLKKSLEEYIENINIDAL